MIRKQSDIDRQLSEIKKFYQENYPLCGYCGHLVRGNGELSHIIRRSYSRELQTVKLNLCLCHHDCHSIWDDAPHLAIFLPRICEILYIVWRLDQNYFHQISCNFMELCDIFEMFPNLNLPELEHHGQVLQLTYLYK